MTFATGEPVRRDVQVTRADLIRYAGAACDFNLVHWSDSAAHAAGLPGVIAHGMFSMALAMRVVEEECGTEAVVTECRARFTAPFVVPDGVGAVLTVTGVASQMSGDGETSVELSADADGVRVLTGDCRLRTLHRIAEDG